ncbi:SLAM family member 6-like [Alosa sapidissima]|uniref:SLAM family member 6-like n=1 Tax=Alosa sapidissima TaxID=34773 RepID=UPI001C0A3FB9|nr:SLAM family member 6-like [Alosa sapidissima]
MVVFVVMLPLLALSLHKVVLDEKCIILLLAAILHKVASAPESVFALEGNSVTLTMKENYHLDVDEAHWILNRTCNVVKYYPDSEHISRQLVVLESYKGRVEFDNTTFSLELKNLQKNDSGHYQGQIKLNDTDDINDNVVEYWLSIVEQVSAPNLTVEPGLSSGDLCNMTVTCTAGDLSLTSSCNSSTCTQEELTMSSSLAIGIRDGDIICNHSNQLNWSHATVRLCQNTQQSFITGPLEWKLIIIAGGLALGGLFICGVLYFRMHVTNKAGSLSSHIYQSVENLEKNQTDLVCAKALSPSSDVKSLSAFKSQSSSSHAEIGPSQSLS